MRPDARLDYAVFQLSPRRTHCELFVYSDGNTEKLASGLMKPFVTHLKVAEEQVTLACQSVKLDIDRCKIAGAWFTKGTLERFVRFVSTPEVLELVNTFDAEVSQLEAARRIYSQGAGDRHSGTLGGGGTGITAAADATKQELLRAIDVRLVAVRQDLTTAWARAAAAGFNPDTVSDLKSFADQFGAHRLTEACSKFISLFERRPDLFNSWKAAADDRAIRSSYGSDMSIDDEDVNGGGGTTDPEHSHAGYLQNLPHKHPAGGGVSDATQPQQDQRHRNHHLDQSASTCQPPKPSSVTFPLRRGRESSVEKDDVSSRENDVAVVEEVKKEETLDQADSSTPAGPPARRLSVQDRINLFENKQKSNSGSGGKPLAGKPPSELRRLSSDVSSAPAAVEKAVLRRWSGASDMSIDLSGEKKEAECSLSTPPSSSLVDEHIGLNDGANSPKSDFRNAPGDSGNMEHADSERQVGVTTHGEELPRYEVGLNPGAKSVVSSIRSKDTSVSNKLISTVGKVEREDWKDQTLRKSQSRSSSHKGENSNLKDHTPQTNVTPLPGDREKQYSSTDQGNFRGSFGRDEFVASEPKATGLKDQASPQTPFGAFVKKVSDGYSAEGSSEAPRTDIPNRSEDAKWRDQSVPRPHFKGPPKAAESGMLEAGSRSRIEEAFTTLSKGIDSRSLASLSRKSSGGIEEAGIKDLSPSEKQSGNPMITKIEDTELHTVKIQKRVPTPEQIKKLQGRTDESSFNLNSMRPFSGKVTLESEEAGSSISMTPTEQVPRGRQARGNQELNDELKMKANELEKLFAEHKLRVPGEQSNSFRRSKPADMQTESAASLPKLKATTDIASAQLPDKNTLTEENFNSSSWMKVVDSQSSSDSLNQNFSEIVFSDDSRGKLYDRYMQKRNAKLRDEWGSKGAAKEAKLKAMHDTLERSKAELKAKFSGLADRQDSVTRTSRRAERLRSFNIQSTMKREQPLTFVSSEDDDLAGSPEHQLQDRPFCETSLADGVSRSTLNKKLLLNKSLSSSTLRASATPVPRSTSKVASSTTGRRRLQSENPLVQSVPNFSDLRKENTKPSSAASKTTPRPQLRNYARSRSTSEEMSLVKEAKPQRPQSLRKSSASPAEFKDTSLNSDEAVLTLLKVDREQTEVNQHNKFFNNFDSQTFLGKGNGIGPGAGISVAKQLASVALDNTDNEEEEFDELAFEPEDSVSGFKDEVEKFDALANQHHVMLNNGESRLGMELEKLANSGSENDELVADLHTAMPSNFQPVGFVHDSPGESPVSWNLRSHNPFSYPIEASDIDASVDSPVGSPASWNSHALNQTETDASRMRKKWGSAQKPVLASSHNQSRKDVTKGFKRLLQYGRKSRGTDSLVDWISATTSEGDDDTEDGRDPATRSSEDLRKSRMGFLQGHLDDGFHENEFFSEQDQALQSSIPAPPANFKLREDHLSGSSMKAPRSSFFSLSSFRSKSSDSKHR